MNIYKCHFGCGQNAIKQNKSGKWICSPSSNSCPENRRKNSEKIKQAHKEGKIPGWNKLASDYNIDRGWAKGLTRFTDERIKRGYDSTKLKKELGEFKPSFKGKKHSETSKSIMRQKRLETIELGKFDSSGRKGHRGSYKGVYFHSSWELAFFVYYDEYLNVSLKRNTEYFDYEFENSVFKTIPDFVDEKNNVYEIKGYLYSDRDNAKYSKTKDKIIYKFKEDIKPCLEYCKLKYGNKFYEKLYNMGD